MVIDEYTFDDCTRLTTVTISDSVVIINQYAFKGCTNLENVYIDTTGWYYTNSSTATSGASVNLSADPATTATYLKSTYCDYYLKRTIY
jgi:hypothetical protein